jgi:hypothetical protein
VVRDVNNDEIPDIAVSDEGSNQVTVLLGDGDGTFGSASSYDVAKNPWGWGAVWLFSVAWTSAARSDFTPASIPRACGSF